MVSEYKHVGIRHCVFCMPILLRICLSGSAHKVRILLTELLETEKSKPKKADLKK